MENTLFRGKRLDNGEWVYGFYMIIGSKRHYIFTEKFSLPTQGISFECYLVDPKTVGQYTGLVDMNSWQIFAGDIVRLTDEITNFVWLAIVRFGNPNCEYSWGWQLEPIKECPSATDILMWVETEETGAFCEVIGNIYDNPELLGEVKE